MMELRRPRKAAAVVAEQVALRIKEKAMQPNERVGSESDLIAQYGYGRAAIREAIRLLEEDGLVKTRPGPAGGIFVSRPSYAKVTKSLCAFATFASINPLDFVEARMEIELACVRLAGERASAAAVDDLKASVTRTKDLLYDQDAVLQEDVRFHLLLATASGNCVLSLLMHALHGIILESTRGVDYGPKHLDGLVAAHERIVQAIEAGDADAAARRMHRHFNVFFELMQDPVRRSRWEEGLRTYLSAAAVGSERFGPKDWLVG